LIEIAPLRSALIDILSKSLFFIFPALLGALLVVQSIHIHRFDGGFGLTV
jgi:hypothetical protein